MSKLFSKDDFRDNCGFGLIADINGIKSHKIINKSINALRSMTHRGAIGADGKTGDGCGLLLNLDKDFYVFTGSSVGVVPIIKKGIYKGVIKKLGIVSANIN